jgi:hypothetical protein
MCAPCFIRRRLVQCRHPSAACAGSDNETTFRGESRQVSHQLPLLPAIRAAFPPFGLPNLAMPRGSLSFYGELYGWPHLHARSREGLDRLGGKLGPWPAPQNRKIAWTTDASTESPSRLPSPLDAKWPAANSVTVDVAGGKNARKGRVPFWTGQPTTGVTMKKGGTATCADARIRTRATAALYRPSCLLLGFDSRCLPTDAGRPAIVGQDLAGFASVRPMAAAPLSAGEDGGWKNWWRSLGPPFTSSALAGPRRPPWAPVTMCCCLSPPYM